MAKFDDGRLLLAGCRPWEMGPLVEEHITTGRCPICRGRKLSLIAYCLWCDSAGLDPLVAAGRVQYKGEPIGKNIRPEYMTPEELAAQDGKATPTKLEPDASGLRGGKG
jgi:hypothetical protein